MIMSHDSWGQRLKAERVVAQSLQVTRPNGGESFHLGSPETINWNGAALIGEIKLELVANGTVAGVIADNIPAAMTSYNWLTGKIGTGWVTPGSDFKIRITAASGPAITESLYYLYGADGKLLSEYDSLGTCIKDYLYLGGKLMAEFQPVTNKYYYYTSDQINSTRMMTDSTGSVVYSRQYDPYGGLLATQTEIYKPRLGFSGKEREGVSELDYFGARYYDHKAYRFNSVDPIINREETLANPQLWGLYTYCRNNPITFFDPNGKDVNNESNDYVLAKVENGVTKENKIEKLVVVAPHSIMKGEVDGIYLRNDAVFKVVDNNDVIVRDHGEVDTKGKSMKASIGQLVKTIFKGAGFMSDDFLQKHNDWLNREQIRGQFDKLLNVKLCEKKSAK